MTATDRRNILALLGAGALAGLAGTGQAGTQSAAPARARPAADLRFIAEAERMRLQAVAAGDQSYGAVLVKADAIVGWGPSRAVTQRNSNAHAERVAIWDAQARLGTKDLSGTVLYSTSIPCAACQAEAARFGVARMFWGPKGVDAGVPRGG